MTRDEIIAKYKQYLFPSVTTYFTDPLVTEHASMQYLWDTEGKKYLDFFGGIVTISVGHSNPRVTTKIKAQIDKIQHASTVLPNEAIVALAEKLAKIAPGEISKTYFTNSGTEANETAVQLIGLRVLGDERPDLLGLGAEGLLSYQLPEDQAQGNTPLGPLLQRRRVDGQLFQLQSSGFFALTLPKSIRRGHPVVLHYRHPQYRPLDVKDYVGDQLYIVHLVPLDE